MKQEHGYTLIELLLYVAITAILLGGLVSFFALTTSSRVKNQSISEVNQQGLFIMETITQAVRNADSITTPTANNTTSSLTVASANASLNPTIISLSGSNIQIQEGNSGATVLNNNKVAISNLSVENTSRSGTFGSLQISFTISRVNPTGVNDYDFQRTFTGSASLR